MQKYNIPIENVIRHYDVTHKNCPAPFVENTKAWDNFKNMLKGDEYMHIKANYEYNGWVKSLDVINENGTNYVKVRDIAEILNKNVIYNSNTKITKLDDILKDLKIEVQDNITTVKAISSNGFNFIKARDIADVLNLETGYNETNKAIFFKAEKSILDRIKQFGR